MIFSEGCTPFSWDVGRKAAARAVQKYQTDVLTHTMSAPSLMYWKNRASLKRPPRWRTRPTDVVRFEAHSRFQLFRLRPVSDAVATMAEASQIDVVKNAS